MFLALDALAIPAIALRDIGQTGWGLLARGLATAWAAWAIYGNDLVCCKKCRNAWLLLIISPWILFAMTPRYFHGAFLVVLLVLGAAGSMRQAWRDRRRTRQLVV